MAANTSPLFVLTPNTGFARVTAANLTSDGSGALSTLFTAGAFGSMVFKIRYANSQATAAASSAMVVRFFLTDDAGNNPRLLGGLEIAIPAATRSTIAVGVGGVIDIPGGLVIPTGSLLKVIQSIYASAADQMDYIAEGGDY